MIVYGVRMVPADSPMGDDIPLTIKNLLLGAKRMYKSWSVLFWGSYFLLRFREFSIWKRLAGVVAHVSTFVVRYKKRLAKDFLLIAISTMAAFPLKLWKYMRRFPLLAHLDSRLKNFPHQS